MTTYVIDSKTFLVQPHVCKFNFSLDQNSVISLFLAGKSFFLTGLAGSGKTTIVDYLLTRCYEGMPPKTKFFDRKRKRTSPPFHSKVYDPRHIAVTAMTNSAALIISPSRGTSLHRWAGCKLAQGTPEELFRKMSKHAIRRWCTCRVLIVDESSMMSADLFAKFNRIAQLTRKSEEFFGGLQLILIGDFLQILPIEQTSMYLFESKLWNSLECVILRNNFRQSVDNRFATLLQEVRFNRLSKESIALLQSRCIDSKQREELFRSTNPTYIEIHPLKKTVQERNVSELAKLLADRYEGGEEVARKEILLDEDPDIEQVEENQVLQELPFSRYRLTKVSYAKSQSEILALKIWNENQDRDGIIPCVLNLALGARVMLVANISPEKGLVNGRVGIVVGYERNEKDKTSPRLYPKVEFAAIKDIPQRTELILPTALEFHDPITDRITGRRIQVPLILAYAATYHKVQGATLQHGILIAQGIFQRQMFYTGLSRFPKLENLFIFGLTFPLFAPDPKCVRFYEQLDNKQQEVDNKQQEVDNKQQEVDNKQQEVDNKQQEVDNKQQEVDDTQQH
jgi:ATP-dependent DNA helicase PIF1